MKSNSLANNLFIITMSNSRPVARNFLRGEAELISHRRYYDILSGKNTHIIHKNRPSGLLPSCIIDNTTGTMWWDFYWRSLALAVVDFPPELMMQPMNRYQLVVRRLWWWIQYWWLQHFYSYLVIVEVSQRVQKNQLKDFFFSHSFSQWTVLCSLRTLSIYIYS